MIQYKVALFAAFFSVLPLRAGEQLTRYTFTEPHMGTQFRIIVYAETEQQARKAVEAAFARIALLDRTMSDYQSTSELMQLCAKAGGPPAPVSPELFFVLKRAQEVSRISRGAFDVTIRPVVRLWRLSRRTQRLPDPAKLAEARALVGYKNILLDEGKRTVQLKKPGMQIDLGGIAKGYAADQAHAVLKKHGITRALVAAGGDVTVSDPPPGSKGWEIAIAPIEKKEGAPATTFLLANGSVSTSGDLNQFALIDGKRYSHIVDPKTGIGLLGRMSVTVVAPDGITADSLATAISILGSEAGKKLIADQKGVSFRHARMEGEKVEVIYGGDFFENR